MCVGSHLGFTRSNVTVLLPADAHMRKIMLLLIWADLWKDVCTSVFVLSWWMYKKNLKKWWIALKLYCWLKYKLLGILQIYKKINKIKNNERNIKWNIIHYITHPLITADLCKLHVWMVFSIPDKVEKDWKLLLQECTWYQSQAKYPFIRVHTEASTGSVGTVVHWKRQEGVRATWPTDWLTEWLVRIWS